jgi:hypothetical protein
MPEQSLHKRLTRAIKAKDLKAVQTLCAEINQLDSKTKEKLFTTRNDLGEPLLLVAARIFLQALPSMLLCIKDLDEAAQIRCLIIVQDNIYVVSSEGRLTPHIYNTLGCAISNAEAPYQSNLFQMFDSLKENAKLALWRSPCYLFAHGEQKKPIVLATEIQPNVMDKCLAAIKKLPIADRMGILQSARGAHPAIAREIRKTVDAGIKELLSDHSGLQKLIKNKMQSMKYWSDAKKKAMLSAMLELRDPETHQLSDEKIKAALKDKESNLSKACNLKRFGGFFCQRHAGSYRAFLDEVDKPDLLKKS